MAQLPSVCIYGAGSIGVYVGGRLQAAGVPMTMIGRPRVGEQIAAHGLRLTDWQGADIQLPADAVAYHCDDDVAARADLVIVTVKSAATEEVGKALAGVVGPQTVVMSLQNGVGNGDVLRAQLPDNPVLSAMISFNVVQRGNGHFHAGTEGELMSEPHPVLEILQAYFNRASLPLELRDDMLQVQWAKLAMNLNNGVNALSNIPLQEQLRQRDYRRCLALLIRETLAVLKRANIRPARVIAVPISWIPLLMSTPDAVFKRVANSMLAMDPLARSSMWEDLELGRTTEIDWLSGEVVRLAKSVGVSVPANEKMVELIKAAEQGGRREWSGAELLAQLQSAGRS